QPLYRCLDCLSSELLCMECCSETHGDRPLDIIQKWNGRCFEQVFLKDLGLVIQLGHHRGEGCEAPRRGNIGFVVIHTNGLHPVSVDYCNCPGRNLSYRQQCIRHRWFPATQDDPQTCATFRVLNLFHKMTLDGKVSVYDFLGGIEKMTNNGGIAYQKDRYKSFARMSLQYRHLLMLKRSGRGNDLEGRRVEETKPGECAIECIACSRPEINLPKGWDKTFLYFFFVVIDACFCLKRRLVSNEFKDPGLGTGWTYFVEDPAFRGYLKTLVDITHRRFWMSTCSGLAALDYANTCYSRGYGSTGVAIGVCARHELVQRTGAVDLQKGERYANMDYAYGSILRHVHPSLHCVNSYDIVCQWHKNLASRMEGMPDLVRVDIPSRSMDYVIPKLHIHGHNLKCQLSFSLNYTLGVGRTDVEGIERPWANIGPVATSTREMGPGTRHDTLDDHLHHWNWTKMVALGRILWKRLRNAISERNAQERSLEEFTVQQAESAEEWIQMVKDWETKCVYCSSIRFILSDVVLQGMTENDVRLILAEQEKEDEKAGVPSIHHISPSAFIAHGLELEELQRRLDQDIKSKVHMTAKDLAMFLDRRTRLGRAIGRFRAIQSTYTPTALQVLAEHQATLQSDKEASYEHLETILLMLPSALTRQQREQGCRQGLLEIELKLRDAQMRRALDQLRNHLHIRMRLVMYCDSNVRHQAMLMRSRAMIARNDVKTEAHKHRYQVAWEAMRRANGLQEKDMPWKKLREADVRSEQEDLSTAADEAQLTREDIRNQAGNGYHCPSWIWMQGGMGEMIDEERMRDGIRVEYCKAYARCQRWREEVLLLKEEMRRSLVSLKWKERWWEERAKAPAIDDAHADGISSYAHSQASVMRALHDRFL
ncbi:hypothetical protein K435DRAFT_575703, partial [Dendrothele bispora CBS 962.96]